MFPSTDATAETRSRLKLVLPKVRRKKVKFQNIYLQPSIRGLFFVHFYNVVAVSALPENFLIPVCGLIIRATKNIMVAEITIAAAMEQSSQ